MVFRHNILLFGNNKASLGTLQDSQRRVVKYMRAIKHTHIHAFSRYLKLTAGGVKQLTVRDRAREKEIKTGIDFLPSPSVHLFSCSLQHHYRFDVFPSFPTYCRFRSLMWSFCYKNFSTEQTSVSLPSIRVISLKECYMK